MSVCVASLSHMSSISDALAVLEGTGAEDWAALPVSDRLATMAELETLRRRALAVSGSIAASLDRDPRGMGGICHKVIADVLRIGVRESARRVRDGLQMAPRITLTGEVLEPELPATAAAWHAGTLDVEHLRTIQRFHRDLPEDVPAQVRVRAEEFLAEQSANLRPDQLDRLADRLALEINPDGVFSDEYRARQRGLAWTGPQRRDGMSIGRLVATPELRALLDAWFAKHAAPGMCNPADETPTVTGDPAPEAAQRDQRSVRQRQHDALAALLRGRLGDPALGRHRGLPVTVIVSATLEQLRSGAGQAVTAGGSLLPMRDLIRMASHAWHYLAVFDGHEQRPLYLGRAKRIATADQRIVLHARDRGCTAPGCAAPGYLCEVHHLTEWSAGGSTDIDGLIFGCGPHHALLTDGGWTVRKHPDGSVAWIPPPHLPIPAGANTYHHPEQLLPEKPPGEPEDDAAA